MDSPGQRNAAPIDSLVDGVASGEVAKAAHARADRRDGRDAPAGRQILNGVPKLRRVGYLVCRQQVQQPRSPNRGSLAALLNFLP